MSNLTDIANLELVFDSRLKAKFLSWLGWRNANIAEALGENENTIASWKARDKWDKAMGDNRVEQALQIRLMTLVMKEKKNSGDYKELSELFKNYKEFVRLERYRDGGNEADLNPKVSERGKAKNAKPILLMTKRWKNWCLPLKSRYLIINALGIKQAMNELV